MAEIGELALAYRAGALAEANLYHLFVDRAVPQLRLGPDDVPFAMGSFDRVLHTLRRCAAAGLLGGRTPEDVGRQLWAVVHGLASLELAGFLGTPDAATPRWRDTIAALVGGFGLP